MPAKSYVISVSLAPGCYRHIQIAAGDLLVRLHSAILEAFSFDDDHAHAFFLDNKAWNDAEGYFSDGIDDAERFTDEYTLDALGLRAGRQFKYVFDFGEDWGFQCKVLRELDEETQCARVIRSVGEAPPQYGDPEDEDDFDGDEDEGDEDGESDDGYPEVYDREAVEKLYSELPLPPKTVERLRAYFDAFANLYGILSLRKALEIYSKQNDPIPEDVFLAFAEIVRHAPVNYAVLGEDELFTDVDPCAPMDRDIIAEHLLIVDDDYEDTKAMQDDKPYYIPGKQTLLKYADDHYFEETPEFRALRDHLRFQRDMSFEKADDIAAEMHLLAAMNEQDMNEILGDAQRIGMTFGGREDLQAFMALYIDMANNARMHINRGHTPNELGTQDGKPYKGALAPDAIGAIVANSAWIQENRGGTRRRLDGGAEIVAPRADAHVLDVRSAGANAPQKKVGRNEPCPCGSGKKYKKCCGKEA